MVKQVAGGQTELFEQIVERYRQQLYACVYAVLRHPKDAEDALQEAFVRIYLSLPQYQGQGFKTWATRIAVNMAIDHKRRIGRRQEVPAGAVGADEARLDSGESAGSVHTSLFRAGTTEPVDVTVMKEERRTRIQALIHTMPEGYRSVVQAFYLEEKSYKEIAELEQVELKTIESRLYRAKQWIRKSWKEEDWE
ncbi:RNA polymerase sigma factor [Paenibacillus tarimensis]